jgi:integrase
LARVVDANVEVMDQLIRAARERKRPRDPAIFTVMRTGMRRGSVARRRGRNLYAEWGLRGVPVKGGKTRDIPLPACRHGISARLCPKGLDGRKRRCHAGHSLFWSSWGRRLRGKVRQPMTGQNIWRLCKVYGRLIRYPELKPHDLRHGVAMEVYTHHRDLELECSPFFCSPRGA